MEINERVSGFAVKDCTALPELAGRLWQMEHEKSGARLVWLDREEENRTFGIAFRTLPEDDTGVFHILEHSVLCGSDRYPVREPFVELMKSSLQTFLNAMTFPDKTLFPFSSRNPKDFLNLMRVYMDAVLHPLIYSRPEIFRQEGWHYELPENGGAPTYKGVVFNEMKGAFSSPDMRMQSELFRRLFPDTSYRHVSGGDPAHIPHLTYEQFLNAHQTFYHPSNSYIFLDGRLDIGEVLSILDAEYLSAYNRNDEQPKITLQAPVTSDLIRASYEISPDEPSEGCARLAWGLILGDYACREEMTAMQALADVLCGGNQAPLKQKLLSAGLAQDVSLSVMDGILQPYVVLELQNMDEKRTAEAERAVREELKRLVREGLDHEQIAASLANLEFQMRERDFGRMPQGLGIGMNVMESWIYGGSPAANLEVGELFARLNLRLNEGYFEALLERVLLKNNHSCQVLLVPSATLGEENRAAEAKRLEAAGRSWSPDERAALYDQQKKLEAWQSSADTPEGLASLPVLHLSDIPTKPGDIPLETSCIGNIPLLRHTIPTGGVEYVNLYFDVSDLTKEELPCASFLCTLLGELDTGAHSSLALQKLRRFHLGALHFSVEPLGKINEPDNCRTYLRVSFSALETKLGEAVGLVSEIIAGTRFDDNGKLLELLRQSATQMEQGVVAAGHSFAMTRVSAGFSAEGAVREYTGGISYCRWLKELEKGFENRSQELVGTLQALSSRIFVSGRLTASITSAETTCLATLERKLLPGLPVSDRQELPCAVQSWGTKKEGIIIPADVSFAAMGGSLLPYGVSYSGTTQVAGRVVSLTYLWNTIRMQGGAYGTGLALGDSGNACFYSYRDPNAACSLGCYQQTDGFLRQFCAAEPDLTGFIIGAAAASDPLLLPSKKGQLADSFTFKGVTYADRCRERDEILSADCHKMIPAAEAVRQIIQSGSVCVIGSGTQIGACHQELDEVSTL